MTTEIIISIASVVIAIVSAVIAGMAISQNNKLQKKALTHQNYEDMKDWFHSTLYLMKQLQLKHLNSDKKTELSEVLVSLTTEIDLGRIFFKNQKYGDCNINKPEVFRGKRPIILDILVLYYDIFDNNLQAKNQDLLRALQRAYINEMVKFLDKNKFSNDYIEYTDVDPEDIIDIKYIDNEKFRQLLICDDIVRAIKEEGLKHEDFKKKPIRNKKAQ